MTPTPPPARTPARPRRRLLAAGLPAVLAITGATLGCQAAPSSSAPSSASAALPASLPPPAAAFPPTRRGERQGEEQRGALGEADGVVPDGTTVFDDTVPAVARLDADLLTALRRAAAEAADDRVAFTVTSGWRSAAYQNQLLREAITTYGSAAEAARWVATPATSPHVSGDAADLGPAQATAWLAEHGAEYGLCPIYRNEPWHYELRPEATVRGCPPLYDDPTQDPRMQP